MFEPKKAIPPIAAAMLALTGCGDNSAGDGGSGGGAGSGGNGGSGATGTGGTGATGTGGTGATGTGGSGGSVSPTTLQKALDAYCMKLVECNSMNPNPNPNYATVETCKLQDNQLTRYDYATSNPGGCGAAFAEYWYCFAENDCFEVIAGTGIVLPFCEDQSRLNGPEVECPEFFEGYYGGL